jgi:hypothetical protein
MDKSNHAQSAQELHDHQPLQDESLCRHDKYMDAFLVEIWDQEQMGLTMGQIGVAIVFQLALQ